VNPYTPMATVIPEGRVGEATIQHMVIGEREASATLIRTFITREAPIPEGTYARLLVRGHLMMSDTPMEQRSNYEVIHQARGDVLIAGLGVGMVVLPILAKPEVKSVLVVEKSPDVIALVEAPLRKALGDKADRLVIQQADVYEFEPARGQKWDVLYFDVWGDVNSDDLKDSKVLRKKFGRRKNRGGWVGCWVDTQKHLFR